MNCFPCTAKLAAMGVLQAPEIRWCKPEQCWSWKRRKKKITDHLKASHFSVFQSMHTHLWYFSGQRELNCESVNIILQKLPFSATSFNKMVNPFSCLHEAVPFKTSHYQQKILVMKNSHMLHWIQKNTKLFQRQHTESLITGDTAAMLACGLMWINTFDSVVVIRYN